VNFVVNFIETTTKEPAFAASGRLSTKLATKKMDDRCTVKLDALIQMG
jgi:hypothetical protein